MDTIYEEHMESGSTHPPRQILKASRSQKPKENDENMEKEPSKESNPSKPVEKVLIRLDRLQVVRVLGEGAFGEVALVVDKDDHTVAAAMKKIYLRGLDTDTRKAVKKEALLQRAVKQHPNVLKYLTMRAAEDVFELYLEYADGGELFDQIEPDYGMEPIKAQFFFRQLLNGLAYIHSCGIAHRDIKPENLLLTKDNVLKISDFGMATVFRHGNDERWLNTRCGTMPYAAPEVLTGKYHGEPADVWSCGVVLVTMLVGELPWAAPKMDSLDFKEYVENNALQNRPWCRLDTIELSLLSMIFTQNPAKRATISRIKKHPWYIGELGNRADWKRKIPECDSSDIVPKKIQKIAGLPLTQPSHMKSMKDNDSVVLIDTTKPCHPLPSAITSFSQPANFDSMILNRSQVSASQFVTYAHPIASMVRRLTRFFVSINVEQAITEIEKACQLCNCEFRMSTSHQILITCMKNEELSFLATVYEMVDNGVTRVLIDFRRSRGDGIEFKRRFMDFKKLMGKFILKHSSSWLEKHGLLCRRNAQDIVAAAKEKISPSKVAEV